MIAKVNRPCTKGVKTMLRWLASLMLLTSLHSFAQSTGSVTYVYTDPQGTPLAEADASGNITATFEYTPYGTFAPTGTSNPGADPKGPGYTGHVNDPETNLVYMQARYYDPATGRFLSIDPDGLEAGSAFKFNRYGYTNNNPINHIDPNGKCIEDACIGEAILVAEGVEYLVSAYEASEAVAATTEIAATTTATTATATATTASLSASQTVAACAANTTCTGLAVTTATAVTAKVVQEIQNTSTTQLAKEHTKNARPSSKGKHEKGNTRRKQDAGGEKGDKNRPQFPRQRPDNWKGSWPPKSTD